MRFLLIILLIVLSIKCSQHNFQPSNKMVLYADYTQKKLFVLNTETLEEFSVLDDISEQDRFIFWGKDKILRIPPQGTDAAYFEYIFYTNKWYGRNYKSNDSNLDITTGVRNFNDSLLILSGINNIYYETPYNSFSDTIITHLGFIVDIKCSSTGVLAVLYSDSERVDFFARKSLLFFDLLNKKIIRQKYKPFYLEEWSYDGKYLGLIDSSTQKKLEYPSLKLIDDKNSHSGYKYLNDSLFVYTKNDHVSDNYLLSSSQLYIHNLNDNSDTKLTDKPTRKRLFDVYYK